MSSGALGFTVITADGSVIRRVQLKGSQRVADIEWSPIADQVVLLTRNESDGRSIVISATSEGHNQRQLYEDALPINAICSSPVADALYLLRQRDDTHELVRLRLTGLNGSAPARSPHRSAGPCHRNDVFPAVQRVGGRRTLCCTCVDPRARVSGGSTFAGRHTRHATDAWHVVVDHARPFA